MNHLEEARAFVQKFHAGNYTDEEHREFLDWLHSKAALDEVELICADHEACLEPKPVEVSEPSAEWVAGMERKLDLMDQEKARHRARESRRKFRRYAVAASILVVFAALYRQFKVPDPTYRNPKTSYNTITVPRGHRPFGVKLPDSTVVWLNAESTLKFPADWYERSVIVTGEAYFQVAKSKKPFTVEAGNTLIRVLGTSFIVKCYPEDKTVRTTVESGSVQVQKGTLYEVLKQGDQAETAPIVTGALPIKIAHHVNAEHTLAWKLGYFYFDGVSWTEVFRQIERAYNVKITVPANFNNIPPQGKYFMRDSLQEVFKDMGISMYYTK